MGKNNAIVMYTLTLLETCVKNCDQRFKALICQKDFINELVKLIGAKFDAPQIIQERVLSLIQVCFICKKFKKTIYSVGRMLFEEIRL